jgi:hypothetical protein
MTLSDTVQVGQSWGGERSALQLFPRRGLRPRVPLADGVGNSWCLRVLNQVRILHGVASGCAFLASKKVVHRAICAENVLVGAVPVVRDGEEGVPPVKLANFGQTREVYVSNEYVQVKMCNA